VRGGTQSVSRVKPVRVDRNGKAVIISREGDRADWTVEEYRDRRGHVPIIEYLDPLQLKDRARVLRSFAMLEDYGPALKMPHAGHGQGKLGELRIDGRPNSYRVLYVGVPERKLIPLHIFAKKADEAPPREIE
jgi:phage-related protein